MTHDLGPPVGEGKKDSGVPFRVRGFLGRGLFSLLGRKASRGPIFLFLFLFFLFFFCSPFSSISFSKLVQIDSNQLCKVPKIQNNNP
jgi:hypothetical protein